MTAIEQKYNVVLKFLNKILVNIGKPEITQLDQFVDINRNDIIKEENEEIIKDMEEDIFGPFDKKAVKYNSRHTYKNYILTLLKKMMADIDYNFSSIKKKCQNQRQVEYVINYSAVKK